MLKKLTTTTLNQEKKEVMERTANICLTSQCLAYCGGLRDVYSDNFTSIKYS